jgi:hypothetical protein
MHLVKEHYRGLPKPRWQDHLLGQEDRHFKDHTVGKDRAGRGPSEGGRHLRHPCGPRVEQVGHATPGDHEGEGQKGGIRLGGSIATVVLRDVTPRLRLVGCSLRVVGRLVRDVGRIPREVGGVHHKVGR